MLGGDNDSILRELGYGAEKIERLKLTRVLHSAKRRRHSGLIRVELLIREALPTGYELRPFRDS
jgi:hypothetical protein